MNLNNYRLDYVFSYWIFVWFILYYYKIIKYSPLFILLIAIIENFFLFIIHIFNFIIDNSYYNFFKLIVFIFINFFIKVLPLYYIIKIENNVKTIEEFIKLIKLIKKDDILMSLYLLIFYIIWLFINNVISIKNYKLNINLPTTTPLYNIIYYLFTRKLV